MQIYIAPWLQSRKKSPPVLRRAEQLLLNALAEGLVQIIWLHGGLEASSIGLHLAWFLAAEVREGVPVPAARRDPALAGEAERMVANADKRGIVARKGNPVGVTAN
jgi:hypothetical protein